jgi:hypothetical protein
MYVGTEYETPDRTTRVEVLICDVPQRLYRRQDDGTLFVEAVIGAEYSVGVTNMAGGRVEVLLAVDGRNTQKDEPADLRNSRGLVVTGGNVFRGWRRNHHSVNAFVFADPARSISAQATGDPSNVGVIGVAVYRERQQAIPLLGSTALGYGRDTFGPKMERSSVGTGMGRPMDDHVGMTTFTRVGDPTILVIRYDVREALSRMRLLEPPAFPGGTDAFGHYRRI